MKVFCLVIANGSVFHIVDLASLKHLLPCMLSQICDVVVSDMDLDLRDFVG